MWNSKGGKKKARKLETPFFTTGLLDKALTSLGLGFLHDRMNLQPAMIPASLSLEAPRPFSYSRLDGEHRISCGRKGGLLTLTVPSAPATDFPRTALCSGQRQTVWTCQCLRALCFCPLCSQPEGMGASCLPVH